MADTRDLILEAGLDVFSERGFQAGTIRAIADRAGVREITVFRHFGSKEGLLAEILKQKSVAHMTATLLQHAADKPVEEVLKEFGRRYLQQMLSRAKLIRFVVLESENNPELFGNVSAVPGSVHRDLSQYLESKMKDGSVRQGSPAALAQVLLSMFFAVVMGKGMLPTIEVPVDHLADLFTNTFMFGILNNE